MTLANNQAGPERRFSWPRSIGLGAAVAMLYFLVNAFLGFVPGEGWFRAGSALLLGVVSTISWRYGWGNARWRSPRSGQSTDPTTSR